MEAGLEPSHHHQTIAQLYLKSDVSHMVRHERQKKSHCTARKTSDEFLCVDLATLFWLKSLISIINLLGHSG